MTVRILVGHALTQLRTLPTGSVQTCVTSPPYFGLRDYGMADQIGLEASPAEFVAAMVAVFDEVRRVLRDDGTLWLNLGDSYASRGTRQGNENGGISERIEIPRPRYVPTPDGFKQKDLIGIPWLVAFALRAAGWYLRGDQIWAKPNGMPESVEDRPTRGHEYVFLFSKSKKYFYDHCAVMTAPAPSTVTRLKQDIDAQAGSDRVNGQAREKRPMKAVISKLSGNPHGRHALGEAIPADERRVDKQRGHSRRHAGFNDRWDQMERTAQVEHGANLRSVWWIPPAQFREKHFAVMPDLLAEICILAGSQPGGGSPRSVWRRRHHGTCRRSLEARCDSDRTQSEICRDRARPHCRRRAAVC